MTASAMQIVKTSLAAISAVTAIAPATRHYPVRAPEHVTAPYILFRLATEGDEELLSGPAGYYESRVTVECISDSVTTADALGEQVKRGLGAVTKATVGEATDVDIYKAATDFLDFDDARQASRRVIDFYLRWK